jgi:metal-responsive CopG/Arc/MetJ family transcriptional regulator
MFNYVLQHNTERIYMNKEVVLQSRVEPELMNQFKEAIELEGQERTMSQVVRSLVREFVRQKQNQEKKAR